MWIQGGQLELEELEPKMKSVSHMSAPLGRFPPLTVKEFQVATATPGAKETAGLLTWAQLMEITLELAPWSPVFEKLFRL